MLLNQSYNPYKIIILNNVVFLNVSKKILKSLQDFKKAKGYLNSKINIKNSELNKSY